MFSWPTSFYAKMEIGQNTTAKLFYKHLPIEFSVDGAFMHHWQLKINYMTQ